MSLAKFFRVRLFGLGISAAILTLGMGLALPASAHDDGPPHHAPVPANPTAVMKAFMRSDHTPESLSSMAATLCVGGFAGSYPCNNVDLEAFMPLADIGGTSGNSAASDIWGWYNRCLKCISYESFFQIP